MKRYAILMAIAAGLAGSAGTAAQAQITSAQQSALRSNCRSDFMSHCSGVTPGGKDALVCLQKNVDKLSGGCQAAVRVTMPAPAPGPAPAAAAKPESAPAPVPATAAAPPAPAPAAAAVAPLPAASAPAAAPKPVPPKAKVAAPRPAATPAPATVVVAAPAAPPPAVAIDPAKLKALKYTCRGDFRRLCKNVPEGPEAFACLQSHDAKLSANCRTAVADLAASIPDGAAMPAATPAAMKPAAVPHRPKAPAIDAAVMIRACKLDMVRHCRGVGAGGGKLLACLTAHEDDLTFRCRAAMKVSSPLH
ncbi:MAG TPA: cysteine rich repeat-containing protein [Pseudolabrys sp.]|nr:cysteine rich repeat-containing protein [Pseudolabrys sp.]